jgi:hypothetical protein
MDSGIRLVAEHREKSQLIGDFLREAAVLWFALYPLEAFFNKSFDWFQSVLWILWADYFPQQFSGLDLTGRRTFPTNVCEPGCLFRSACIASILFKN